MQLMHLFVRNDMAVMLALNVQVFCTTAVSIDGIGSPPCLNRALNHLH